MHHGLTAALVATLVGAVGCAALAPPERPVWQGSDQVGDVAPDQLVGTWRVTPLNPYPDQEAQSTVIEYRADGTVVGQIEPGAESAALLGDARFEMSGRWAVADGVVSHSDVEMDVVSDNAMARMVAGMINGAKRDLGGTADVQELDANRIVMLGTDGAAMRYERL